MNVRLTTVRQGRFDVHRILRNIKGILYDHDVEGCWFNDTTVKH